MSTRLGLVADTHLGRRAGVLPRELVEGLSGVSMILHAGDWVSPEAVALFEALAPVVGVAGNNDPPEIAERFGRTRTLEVGGVRIGLVHGDVGPARRTPDRAFETFAGVDVVVFGHSHMPLVERRDGVWLVNPGSPTEKRRQPRYSYGVLTIEQGRVTPELFYYADRSP